MGLSVEPTYCWALGGGQVVDSNVGFAVGGVRCVLPSSANCHDGEDTQWAQATLFVADDAVVDGDIWLDRDRGGNMVRLKWDGIFVSIGLACSYCACMAFALGCS